MKAFPTNRWFICSTLLLTVASVHAGSFSTDFNSGLPANTAAYGNAFVDSTGGPDGSGCLKLTTAASSQFGTFVLPDLDSGNRIETFVATFNVHMANGTASPADGFSFNFGVAPNSAQTQFGEQGIINGYGLAGISVGFDAYDNGTQDDQQAPEVCVRFLATGGAAQLVGRRKLTNQLKTGAGYVPVMIRLNAAGTLDVYFNSTALFTNLFIAGTGSGGWVFSFGARTGGSYQEHWIDDLNITTVQQANTRRYVKTSVPLSDPILSTGTNAILRIPFQDSATYPIDMNATVLYFNDVQVPINWQYNTNAGQPILSQPVVYFDPGGLPPGSVNTAKLVLADSSGQPPDTYYWNINVTNAPLWTIAPGGRSWLSPTGESATPTVRSLAYSAVSNQLYIVSRFGGSNQIHVLNANTGADLYSLITTNITATGNIPLLSIAVADDGAVYACNQINKSSTANMIIYSWPTPDSSTPPTIVYSGIPTTGRCGDTLAARGSGASTLLLADVQDVPNSCLFYTDSSMQFSASLLLHTNGGTVIGREVCFGPTNTYFLKKKSGGTTNQPLVQMTAYNNTPGDQVFNTTVDSVGDYHYALGAMGIDFSNHIGAGIYFSSASTSYDRLYIYDISDFDHPLQVATYYTNVTATANGGSEQCYNFPVTHVNNQPNSIGQVIIGGGKIFAIDANNGIIAVPEFPPIKTVVVVPPPQKMSVVSSNGSVVISWPITGAGEVLQANPTLVPGNWANTGLSPVTSNGTNSVTITPSGASYYRLAR